VKFKQETDFQETEIGKIPREWKIERLGHIVKYVKGKKPGALFDERPSEEYVPYLTAEYMRGLDKPKWCNPKLENNIIEVFHDDVIMIWDGSYAGHVFTGFNGVLASTMVKIIPVVKLDKKFLYYYLLASFEEFRSTTVGTGVPHVNKKVFEEFPIPVPPIHEQKRIADILSTIDMAIELYHGEKERLESLKTGLMNLLLTGKIRVRED
jgi:type I restriction enzyme S subunit